MRVSVLVTRITSLVFSFTVSALVVDTWTADAFAAVIPVSERQEVFRPPQPNGPLQEFSLIETKKIVRFPKEPIQRQTHLTDVRMILKTATVADIESFYVVQYIKGCQFESEWDGRRLKKHLTISREHFNETKVFKHTDWEIDSDSTDPAYSSFAGVGRFALFRWNASPESFNPDHATYYADAKPPHPVVYLTDLPGGAARFEDINGHAYAKNISLEFQTCLFHARDIPAATDTRGRNIDRSKAIACHAWDHKYIYNFTRNRFESPTAIDPVCL